MNKKGFTLVELLAVIAILAILVIIALPNVMGMFNQAKKNSFTTELKQIYKVAEQQWMTDSMIETSEQTYSRCKTCTGKSLNLSGRTELDYYIVVDKSGKVVKFYATDGTYQFRYSGDLLATQINNVEEVAKLGEGDALVISDGGATTEADKNIVCKRATVLHTEICNNGSYYNEDPLNSRNSNCKGDGYTEEGTLGTNIITYGSLGTRGTLTPGDVFDCDVNGDGVYSSTTERFYYVSPKDNDNSSNYATFIFYHNTNGASLVDNEKIAYSGRDYVGPETAYSHLPSVNEWKRVSLSNSTRQIKNNAGGTTVEYDGDIYNLSSFNYGDKAARFLTFQEMRYACGGFDANAKCYLRNCNYFMENTDYSDNSKWGYYLENWTTKSRYVYYSQFAWRKFNSNTASSLNSGVRPAIEVPLDSIEI